MGLLRICSVRLIVLAVFMIAASRLMFVSSSHVFGQSGRGSPPDKKKKTVKSKLPAPPPLRLPDQLPQDSGVVLRINSDLVTVVTTISRVSQNDPLELNREDFEVLEDGVRQEIANFAREAE